MDVDGNHGGPSHDETESIEAVKDTMQEMLDELNATHEDVRDIRRTVTALVRNDAAQDAAIKILTARITRLKKKVGLAN